MFQVGIVMDLPIEWKIEEEYKKKGKDKKNISVIEFRKECREFAIELDCYTKRTI